MRKAICVWTAALLLQVQLLCFGATTAGWQLVTANYARNLVNDAVYGESSKNGALTFSGTGTQWVLADMRSAPGRNDFSAYVRLSVPTAVRSAAHIGIASITEIAGADTAPTFRLFVDGMSDELHARIGTSSNYRGVKVSNFVSQWGGRTVDILMVRNASTPGMAIYINGLAASATATSGGTPPDYDGDVRGPYFVIGTSYSSSAYPWTGRIISALVFNRALSTSAAAELSFRGVGRDQLGRFRDRIKEGGKNGFFTGSTVSWTAIATGGVTLDTVNDELDVTAVGASDGASLGSSLIHTLNVGRLHRIEFDVRNDSGATTKTVAMGAESIGTCSGNGSFWFEWTPQVSGTALTITTDGAGSFSLAKVRIVEVESYEGGRSEVGYAADFSATADGWTATGGTVTGNIDSIGGQNDVLRFYADGTSSHSFKKTLTGFGLEPVRLTFGYYIPSGNTHLKRITVTLGNGQVAIVPGSYGAWTIVQLDVPPGAASEEIVITALSNTGTTFTGANSVSDDLVYVRAVAVQGLGATRGVGNGSFDEAGHGWSGNDATQNYAGDDGAFTWWFEATAGSTALTRDTTTENTVGGGTARASCKIVVDGSNSEGSVTAAGVTYPGRRYRLKYWAEADATTGTPTLLVRSGTTAVSTNTLTASFAQAALEFDAIGADLVLATGSGCAGRTVWIDSVELEDLGPVVDLDCGVGVGFQVPDRTANGYHGTMASPAIQHGRPGRNGELRGKTSTLGDQQITGAIPMNGRIASIAVYSDGAATVDIGDKSAGAEIATGVALVAGRNEVQTFVSRYSRSGNLWIHSDSAAVLQWDVRYELVDP